jgi:hypothetical protein
MSTVDTLPGRRRLVSTIVWDFGRAPIIESVALGSSQLSCSSVGDAAGSVGHSTVRRLGTKQRITPHQQERSQQD